MWIYENEEINSHHDLMPECTDIVYQIWYTNGKTYIGKKAVRAIRKKPPLAGKKRARRVMTNLPFIDYEGSHTKEGYTVDKKEILYQCSSRKTSTYIEAALLFEKDVLFTNTYLNDNILGKFYPNDLKGLLK